MKKLPWIIVAILGATTILFGILAIKRHGDAKSIIAYGNECTNSFIAGVDYISCSIDYQLGNVKTLQACDSYFTDVSNFRQFIEEDFGDKRKYEYIGGE